ncbi:hypothetical protein GYMLUDRAFT_42734 [Collybiopsis luxurians FD-317 M1]|uniref:Uncharacterized protein n=1 Tax=Collybiopsis luxurians FD-317 M1 TaxID=944289 RepID=A0A0D0CGE9_9AGAR|nr:hypothetical protein GYMLUDRAFT_42734 [Collybiopsis luxurians FD-317 M1]
MRDLGRVKGIFITRCPFRRYWAVTKQEERQPVLANASRKKILALVAWYQPGPPDEVLFVGFRARNEPIATAGKGDDRIFVRTMLELLSASLETF